MTPLLLAIVLTLHISTVYFERGFSYHNITKTKIMNRLSENMDNLHIIILADNLMKNFNFDESL